MTTDDCKRAIAWRCASWLSRLWSPCSRRARAHSGMRPAEQDRRPVRRRERRSIRSRPMAPIFVDWPKPDVALVFSGEQDGYLEPCGCAGLENQKGGLKRRFTFLKELARQGLAGRGDGPRRPGKAHRRASRDEDRLLATGAGENGLRGRRLRAGTTCDWICCRSSSISNEATNPLVSANVGIGDFDSGFTQALQDRGSGRHEDWHHVRCSARRKSPASRTRATSRCWSPTKRIPEVLPELREAKCDQLVLLAQRRARRGEGTGTAISGVRLGDDGARRRGAAEGAGEDRGHEIAI